MGWSRSRWDGDTLVVEVTDFNEETASTRSPSTNTCRQAALTWRALSVHNVEHGS